ncbi:MAG: hypothetical protein ROZ64_08810 [Burkholderiaceae bacterium]|jgi:hypothetical protein|nr:hypothetical protein [Burkholderiaceae bacterium]
MNDSVRSQGDASPSQHPSSPAPSTGRRALLVAMPTIFSLRQGVAAEVARTSAVLVKSTPDTLLCAKDPGLGGNEKGWFVAPDSEIEVTRFTEGRTYCKYDGLGPNNKPQYASVNTSEMCADGGTYYYSPNDNCNNAQNLEAKNVNDGVRGAFVSALSIASFGTRVNITDV